MLIGLSVGIKRMGDGTWTGVGTTFTGQLSSTDSYAVTYKAGDASLTTSSPNYNMNAYRVTVVSTGISQDPSQATVTSSYQAQAVLQLVPRALASGPTNWSTMLGYTLFQNGTGQLSIDPPSQINGPVWLQGVVTLGGDYSSTARFAART